MITSATGAAVELHLRVMLGRAANDTDWLDEFESRLRGLSRRSPAVDRPEIVALLLLRAPAARTGQTRPARPIGTIIDGAR